MKTVIANWKMNLGVRESVSLARGVLRGLRGMKAIPNVELAPSYPALADVSKVVGRSRVRLAAQGVSPQDKGSYTGQVSARVLKEVGVNSVIVGHSEERQYRHVTDSEVRASIEKALSHNMDIVLCVGDPSSVSVAGETQGYVYDQVRDALEGIRIPKRLHVSVAYEPIWAIGSGKTASIGDVVEVHSMIREQLESYGIENAHVLYGGSVTPENAYEFLNNEQVDGVLVGGASKTIKSLLSIINTASEVK